MWRCVEITMKLENGLGENTGYDSFRVEVDGIINGVEGHMEFCSDGVCLELKNGNILEMVAEDCVPLQPALPTSVRIDK